VHVLLSHYSFLDLKVDVHRKNSSESSEEVATLRPVVERVSVHRAEQCTQADHERFRTKLQGNPSCSVGVCYIRKEIFMAQSWSGVAGTHLVHSRGHRLKSWCADGYPDLGFGGFPQFLPANSRIILQNTCTFFQIHHSQIILIFNTA
jgi:hypothetical protein